MKKLYKKTYLSSCILGLVGCFLIYQGVLGGESIVVSLLGIVLLLLGISRYFMLKALLKEADEMSVEEIEAYEQGLGSVEEETEE